MKRYEVKLSEEIASKLEELSEQTGASTEWILTLAVHSYVEMRRVKGDFTLFLKRTEQYHDFIEAWRGGDFREMECIYCDYCSSVEDGFLETFEDALEEIEEAEGEKE